MSTKMEIAENFAKTINSDKIKLMILFGSVARGDFRPDSDIDILVVSDFSCRYLAGNFYNNRRYCFRKRRTAFCSRYE